MVRLDESGKGVGGVGKFEKGLSDSEKDHGGVKIDDSESPPTPGGSPCSECDVSVHSILAFFC
jgi:hypothetical protein